MNDTGSVLTTAGAAGATHYVHVDPTPISLPVRALFDVEVDGLLGFSLIPKCDLACDLAGAWMAGEKRVVLIGFGQGPDKRVRTTRLAFAIEPGPMLTNGGDPFYTGQHITAEERAIALAAIEAHRASKKPAPRRRAHTTRGSAPRRTG